MQSREEDGRPALFRAASIGAILAAFVLVRYPLLTKEASVRGWNGDTAIFGLMAKKIHDGRGFDVFFWGQNYMGPLTPALAAAIRKSVLDPAGAGEEGGPISLRLASMGEIGFGICLYFLGLTRLFGRVIGAAADMVQDALVKAYGVDAGRLQQEGYKAKSAEQRIDLVQL